MATAQPLSFVAALKRSRRAAGLTQEELAERASYSVSYIGMLERGGRGGGTRHRRAPGRRLEACG